MNKLFLALLTIGALSITPCSHADEGEGGLVSDMKQLLRSIDGEYTNYCGQGNWEKAGWMSEKRCLQDGRIHIVYFNNNKGDPGLYKSVHNQQEIQFSQTDKKILFDAIWDGTLVYASHREIEGKSWYKCEASGFYKKQARCSTAEIINLDNSIGSAFETRQIMRKVRFSTDGDLSIFTKRYSNKAHPENIQGYGGGLGTPILWAIRY